MEDLRYPIGRCNPVEDVTTELIQNCITQLEKQPVFAKTALKGLSDDQIDTPYREGGWTVRQVVHHLADAHMNIYVRIKLALTEDNPTVKTYNEEKWADLEDGKKAPVDLSLSLLDAVHTRLVILLNSLQPEDFKKEFIHPEMGNVAIEKYIQFFTWHGKHHIAHIMSLRERMKW